MNKSIQAKYLLIQQDELNIFHNKLKQLRLEHQEIKEEILDRIFQKRILLNDKKNFYAKQLEKIKSNNIKKYEKQELKFLRQNMELKILNQSLLELKNHQEIQEKKYLAKIQLIINQDESKFKGFEVNERKKISLIEKKFIKQESQYQEKINLQIKNLKIKHNNELKRNQAKFKEFDQKLQTEITSKNSEKENLIQQLHSQKIHSKIYDEKLKIINHQHQRSINLISKKFSTQEQMLFFGKNFNNYLLKKTDPISLRNWDYKLRDWIIKNKLILGIIIFSIIVGSIYPNFFSSQNWLTNILNQNIVIGLLALGMTLIILTGAIDLSVGSTLALSAGFALYLNLVWGINLYLTFLIGILLSIVIGIFHGFLSSYGKLQSFIVTLVGLLVFRGVLTVMLKGTSFTVKESNALIDFLSLGYVGVLPGLVFIFIIITIILMFILKWTKFGRYIYAVGSNKQASKASGIKTKLVITAVFAVSGLLVGFAGLSYLGNIGSVQPQTGVGFELSAIAAVVLGGTSLTGGKGGIGKTVIGWLLISVLDNALVFLRVDPNMQLVFRGVIILLAVLFDQNFDFKGKLKKFFITLRGY